MDLWITLPDEPEAPLIALDANAIADLIARLVETGDITPHGADILGVIFHIPDRGD